MESLPFAKKSLGQHWLTDQTILTEIIDLASLTPRDTVLEIGAGFGSLTKLLVQKAGQVVAIELDKKLISQLNLSVLVHNLKIVQTDALKFDLNTLPIGYKVVANIPYYLTSNLIRVLAESANPPQLAVLLIQKEVAERLAARPGEMSVLALTAQYFYDVELSSVVPAGLFSPPPKVDSQVVILKRRKKYLVPAEDRRDLFRLYKAAFSAKRKKLRSSLRGGLGLNKDQVDELLKKAGVDHNLRAQQLTADQWYNLYTTMKTAERSETRQL